MSTASELASANGAAAAAVVAVAATGGGGGVAEDRSHQKSFKRKYRKLRHKFKEVMKRSDELFRREQVAKLAIRRMQEENTRILDLLVDLNSSVHIPKERRHNIGSPSRATPPRFLSPTLLATIYADDPTLLNPNGDVEEMELEPAEAEEGMRQPEKEIEPVDDNESSDDDDEEDEDEKTPAAGQGSKSDSDEDDNEDYLEEMREWKYKRGIAGTPPRSVRERMKANAEQERKDAEEQAKRAAAEAAAEKKSNGGGGSSTVVIKQENEEEEEEQQPDVEPTDTPQRPLILEDYRRGHTPEHLRSTSPFLMTLEEEEEWYDEIDGKYEGAIPPLERPNSPSAAKVEGDPRNPMSVYCWLRKNQPQVFLQGEEAEGGKKYGRGRGGRRKAVEVDSGDEGAASVAAKTAKANDPGKASVPKRRRANGSDVVGGPSAPGGAGGSGRGRGGSRGGRKKAEGEPPLKRPRR